MFSLHSHPATVFLPRSTGVYGAILPLSPVVVWGPVPRISWPIHASRSPSTRRSMRSAAVPGRTDLRRPPGVIGRVGRPAYGGEWLAAIVIRTAAVGETVLRPPAQQAAAVSIPAAGRPQPSQEAVGARLGTGWLPAASRGRDDQCGEDNTNPCLASHGPGSPVWFATGSVDRPWSVDHSTRPTGSRDAGDGMSAPGAGWGAGWRSSGGPSVPRTGPAVSGGCGSQPVSRICQPPPRAL